MKHVRFALAVLCMFSFMARSAEAGEDGWRIILSSSDTLPECRLREVDDSLLYFDRLSESMSLPVDSVAVLIRLKKSRVLAGAGTGMLIGAILGGAIGSAIAPSNSDNGMQNIGPALAVIAAASAFAIGGTLIGGISGGLAGRDDKYRLADSTREGKIMMIRQIMGGDIKKEEKKRWESEKLRRQSEEMEKAVSKQLEKSRAIGTDPEPISVAKADYPELARMAGVAGKVYVSVVVGADGIPKSAKVIKGIGSGCDEAAREAAMGSMFKPGTIKGLPAEKTITMPYSFP